MARRYHSVCVDPQVYIGFNPGASQSECVGEEPLAELASAAFPNTLRAVAFDVDRLEETRGQERRVWMSHG